MKLFGLNRTLALLITLSAFSLISCGDDFVAAPPQHETNGKVLFLDIKNFPQTFVKILQSDGTSITIPGDASDLAAYPSNNRIPIVDRGTNIVKLYNATGNVVDSFDSQLWSGMAISPDGNVIAYIIEDQSRGTGSLMVESRDNSFTGPIKLSDIAHPHQLPCFSPDSKKIAYFTGIPNGVGGFVTELSVHDLTDLLANNAGPRLIMYSNIFNLENPTEESLTISWHPSSQKLLFSSERVIHHFTLNSSQATILTNGKQAVYSPDGNKIAFVNDDNKMGDIYVTNDNLSIFERMTFSSDEAESAPQWSPNGKQILFTTIEYINLPQSKVWTVDVESPASSRKVLIEGAFGVFWLPD